MTAISLLGSVAIAFVAPTLPVGAPTRAVVSMVAPKWAQPQSLIATFLAAAVAIAPMDAAHAARSGGRVGGRAPSSAARSMPRGGASYAPRGGASYAPRTTNVYVAPSMGYGYGMGYGMGYGGISPGTYLGLSLVETLIREQQRQAFLQQQLRTQQELGRDQAMIQQLQAELNAQNAKVEGLKAQQAGGGSVSSVAPQVAPGESEAMMKLLMEQQKEIEALKAAQAK